MWMRLVTWARMATEFVRQVNVKRYLKNNWNGGCYAWPGSLYSILLLPAHAGALIVSLIYGEDKDLKRFILWGPIESVVLVLSLKWLLDIHVAMVPVQLDIEKSGLNRAFKVGGMLIGAGRLQLLLMTLSWIRAFREDWRQKWVEDGWLRHKVDPILVGLVEDYNPQSRLGLWGGIKPNNKAAKSKEKKSRKDWSWLTNLLPGKVKEKFKDWALVLDHIETVTRMS